MFVRPSGGADREWIAATLVTRWLSTTVISRGKSHDAATLPALVCVSEDEERLGLVTYSVADGEMEIVTLDALVRGVGVGTALIQAARAQADDLGCTRLWLITTNDNLPALRFYQRRGFRLVAIHRGAVDDARRRKPSIPLIGEHGIPIHDEIELDLPIVAGSS